MALWNQLPPEERAELCEWIEEQQATEQISPAEELPDEWVEETNRRLTAYERGETIPIDGAEFMAKMKAKYG
jgi:hypothetical protein